MRLFAAKKRNASYLNLPLLPSIIFGLVYLSHQRNGRVHCRSNKVSWRRGFDFMQFPLNANIFLAAVCETEMEFNIDIWDNMHSKKQQPSGLIRMDMVTAYISWICLHIWYGLMTIITDDVHPGQDVQLRTFMLHLNTSLPSKSFLDVKLSITYFCCFPL